MNYLGVNTADLSGDLFAHLQEASPCWPFPCIDRIMPDYVDTKQVILKLRFEEKT